MSTNQNLSGMNAADFSKEVDGKQTALFILKNSKGYEVAITNYGGAVVAIMVPDKDGKIGNVIQGHDNIDEVISSPEPYLSTLIGRYGNRICKGKFTLDGKEYSLAINNGPNALHGGPTGFHRRVWDAKPIGENALELKYVAADMEEGFPGKFEIEVVYTWTDDCELIIDYKGTTDKKTIVNMTHHGYFSIAGIANPTPTIDDLICEINADHYIPIDDTSIPLGSIDPVEGTPFDFRKGMRIGERINEGNGQLEIGKGYDHNWVLATGGDIDVLAAELYCPASGICLKVYTNEPGIQVYAGNFLDGTVTGKKGVCYQRRTAICLETQHYPDSVNQPSFPSIILNPGDTYTQVCIYKFSTKEN